MLINVRTPAEVSCNVCKDSICKELADFTSDLDHQHYHVMKCRRCGLLFLFPLPDLTPERLEEIYGGEYAESVYPDGYSSPVEKALGRQMDIVEKYVRPGDVLNVGAMATEVRALKQRGWRLKMVDASRYAVERARRLGDYDITLSKLEDFACPPESFDFIKLGHVIEHLKDPALALQKVWSLLRGGGVVLIDTDNADGLETRTEAALMSLMKIQFIRRLAERHVGRKYHLRYGRLTPPVHLYTFTAKSLGWLIERQGFEIVQTFNPSWGDPTWFPLKPKTFLESAAVHIDKLGGMIGRGNVIAILARKP